MTIDKCKATVYNVKCCVGRKSDVWWVAYISDSNVGQESYYYKKENDYVNLYA